MEINETNGRIINSRDICIHDDILQEIRFERLEKKLHLSILKSGMEKVNYFIDFIQVIGFEMTSCDFWGASPHILDFEYIEQDECYMIPKLFQMKNIGDNQYCSLDDDEKYIETVITFTSGDRLIIACKSIII